VQRETTRFLPPADALRERCAGNGSAAGEVHPANRSDETILVGETPSTGFNRMGCPQERRNGRRLPRLNTRTRITPNTTLLFAMGCVYLPFFGVFPARCVGFYSGEPPVMSYTQTSPARAYSRISPGAKNRFSS